MSDCPIVQCIESEYYVRNQINPEDPLNPQANLRNQPLQLWDHHKRILNKFFSEPLDYRSFLFSCPKKSAKTEVAAAVTYAFLRKYGGDCYSVANDKEQAESRMFARVVDVLRTMKEHNPDLFRSVLTDEYATFPRIQRNGVIEFQDVGQANPGPHTLRYISSDYAGEAGAMNALVVFDEIWGIMTERAERLWTELQPIPNLPVSIRFVSTYAGFYGESQLLYSIYENTVKPDVNDVEIKHGTKVPGLEDLPVYQDGDYIVYWDEVPRMPWHTEEFLEAARTDPSVQGRESEYERLWRNRWSTGMDAFLPMEVINALMARGDDEGLKNHF